MKQVKNCEEPEECQFQNTKDSIQKEVESSEFLSEFFYVQSSSVRYHMQILQLQKELKDQFIIRKELEKATVNQPSLHYPIDDNSLPKVKTHHAHMCVKISFF